jgi:hypothetical protein
LEDVEMQDLAETPGAIAVADLRRSLEQERESDEENILEDVEMQETTEVPPSVVQSNLVEALPVDEEKEKADAVVAEPVSEEKGAKGEGSQRMDSSSLDCCGHCCGYCGSYNGIFENGTHLVSRSSLDGRVGPVSRSGIDHSRVQHNVA